MNIEKLKEIVSNGKMFTVTFKKKDGSIRTMNCRTGVKKHLKGGTLGYDAIAKGLLTVFEIGQGYKTIPAEGIIEVHANGSTYR